MEIYTIKHKPTGKYYSHMDGDGYLVFTDKLISCEFDKNYIENIMDDTKTALLDNENMLFRFGIHYKSVSYENFVENFIIVKGYLEE